MIELKEAERLKLLIEISKKIDSLPKSEIPTQIFKSNVRPEPKRIVLDDTEVYF